MFLKQKVGVVVLFFNILQHVSDDDLPYDQHVKDRIQHISLD